MRGGEHENENENEKGHNMTDPFDNPGTASGIDYADYNGRLLLITPLTSEKDINTVIGVKDAVRANVVVLDGPGAPEELKDVLIFPRVLQGQIRANVGTGRSNLGRLGQGEKKPGQSPPWKLADPTEADKTLARQYLSVGAASAEPPF
jgi:hypothetical protein